MPQYLSPIPNVEQPAVITVAATTVGAAVAATAATSTTPFGFAEAQANAIVTNLNTLRADVIALRASLAAAVAAQVARGDIAAS
jgi:hypothetical protein